MKNSRKILLSTNTIRRFLQENQGKTQYNYSRSEPKFKTS